ncbi:DedA family protein [Patescibacteria group bacterium]|nr:DedA family protein [Patescibacteria group bacterium]
MLESILASLASLVIGVIETTGYAGIALLMALESANIPIPSEIIMPFSGFLVFEGSLSLFAVVFWGAAGNLIGSLISYALGFWGGRAFLNRFGKYLLVRKSDVDMAETWFAKYGDSIVLLSRVLPVVRTFISLPAGIARMNIWKFSLYTFGGSLVWSFALTYAGMLAGKNWDILGEYFRTFDWAIVLFVLLGAAWWIWRHVRGITKE